MEEIKEIEKGFRKDDIPEIWPGDQVVVYYKIFEGNKERIQPFKGDVIAIKGSGLNRTVTVRKVSYGVGVERIFPLHSPLIEKIVVERRGKVRRAKLYYMRQRTGKATRIKEKRNNL
jgi:large subunit ribosomal protein L19